MQKLLGHSLKSYKQLNQKSPQDDSGPLTRLAL